MFMCPVNVRFCSQAMFLQELASPTLLLLLLLPFTFTVHSVLLSKHLPPPRKNQYHHLSLKMVTASSSPSMKPLAFSSSISISFTLPSGCRFLLRSLDSKKYSNTNMFNRHNPRLEGNIMGMQYYKKDK